MIHSLNKGKFTKKSTKKAERKVRKKSATQMVIKILAENINQGEEPSEKTRRIVKKACRITIT